MQSSSTSPAFSLRRVEMLISGKRRVAAETALDVVAHRVAVHFRLGDQALAQQHLDVAVIARALEHLRLAQLIDAAVADVRPVGRRVLHQAHGAGRARTRLDASDPTPSLTTSSCARPSDRCKKAERIEDGMRRLPECLEQRRERSFGRARTLRVTAHAVDHRQEYGVLGGRHRNSVLILLAMADQAHIRGLDLQ